MPFLKLTKFEQHRLSLFFICLALSILGWLFFALSNPYRYAVNTVVRFYNAPANKAFHPLQSEYVKLVVEGTGWQLLFSKLRFTPQNIKVDLQELNKRNFISFKDQLDLVNKEFDSKQRIVSVLPDTLYFDFSSRKIKRVPVKLVYKISFKNQYGIYDQIKLVPEYVTLSGPEEDLKSITSWETDTVISNNVFETFSTTISLKAPMKPNVDIYPTLIQVKIPVDAFTEKEVEVPLQVKNNHRFDDVKLFPENVKVKLMVSLKNYPLIDKKAFDASVDLDNWKKNGYKQLPILLKNYPEFCKPIKIEPQFVDFIIKK
ncbi:MAG: YbbR-like domain-containing protein [Burkholderiales bacterium]|nr:YbbR-like domain-containing protein [Bacteroidia bacterium]